MLNQENHPPKLLSLKSFATFPTTSKLAQELKYSSSLASSIPS